MRLREINKIIDNQQILKDISLEIPKNQLVAVIGPNGAGKSTLFSILSRIDKKSSGTYTVAGKQIEDWPSADLAKVVALLPQQAHFDLSLTVRELISFGRYPYSQGRLTEEDVIKISDALEYMGLTELANRDIQNLSGGQFQRVLIAMIIAQDTDYVLLDEPLNNLDIKQSIVTMNMLEELVREMNKTVVIVIHDIQMASHYADYLVAMKDGQIFADGPTATLMDDDLLTNLFDTPIRVIQQGEDYFMHYLKGEN